MFIGFDLDQTLYPKNAEIDEAIQKYIYKKIAHHKEISIEEAEKLFKSYYPAMSGSSALAKLEIPHPKETVQEALEQADIAKFLHPDKEVVKLLKNIKKKYGHVALITGSFKHIAEDKLLKLKIPLKLFDFTSFGDDYSKSNGDAYRAWIASVREQFPDVKPSDFIYIGDRKSTDVDVPLSLGMKAMLVNVEPQDLEVPELRSLLELRDLF